MPIIIDARNMGSGSIGSAASGDTSNGTRNNVALVAPWDESKEYLKGDLVTDNGDLYQAQKSVPAGTAITDEAYWLRIVVGVEQSNWYQNDEMAKDYIKNRTHWAEEKAIVKEAAFTIEEGDNNCVLGNFSAMLAAGDICNVVYDGKTYAFTAHGIPDGVRIECDAFAITFKNQPDGLCVITVYSNAGEHTISILQTAYHTLSPKYIKDMYYSAEEETVVGTGMNGWIDVTQMQDVPIPKMSINGTIYENIPVSSVNNATVNYEVGGHQIGFNLWTYIVTITPNDISADDLEFWGTKTVYHHVPDEYMPEWVASVDDIVQSDWNISDKESLAFIKNKPSLFPYIEHKYDADSSTQKCVLKSGLNIVRLSARPSNGLTQIQKISGKRIITNTGVIYSIKTGNLMTEDEYPYGCAVFWHVGGAKDTAYCLNPLDLPIESS